MKQDLFKEIGKLPTKEKRCSEEEINNIYRLVMEKKTYEEKRYNKKIKVSIISFATVAAIACICVLIYSIQNVNTKNDIVNKAIQHTTDAPVILEQNNRIVVCVYAAKNKNQVVTANYAEELTQKKVKFGEKVNIGTYDLLSSTVPGFPLTVNTEKQTSKELNIQLKIETDAGSLVSWDSETGDVADKGKNIFCDLDEKIYWSPLDGEVFSEEATLKIVMYKDNEIIGETFLYIYEEQEASYVVERISDVVQ